jgi:hypothetical protein
MEPESSLLCSQEPGTCPYPEADILVVHIQKEKSISAECLFILPLSVTVLRFPFLTRFLR